MESERWSTGEQHLGSAVHDLQGICDGQQHELALELRGGSAANSSNGRATVHLTCRFLPFSDVLAQDAANFEMGGSVVGTPGQVRPWRHPIKSSPALQRCQHVCVLQIPLAADWQELLELAGIAPNVLTPIAFVEDSATNTQVILAFGAFFTVFQVQSHPNTVLGTLAAGMGVLEPRRAHGMRGFSWHGAGQVARHSD